ncbi:hypothetical protein Tco_0352911 [Tanacetum coccineum]
MASQDARLSKFEANLKQKQGEMTNKIDTFLKAINDRMTGALPNDTVKNPKLNDNSTSSVLFTRSYPVMTQLQRNARRQKKKERKRRADPENINTNLPSPPDPSVSFITEKVCKLNSSLESINLVPQSSDVKFVCIKDNDRDVMFIEIIKNYDDSSEEELREDEGTVTGELGVEYFDIFPTRSELTYHKEDPEGIRGIINSTGRIKGMHIFVRNFTYDSDFMIVEDISSIIDPRLSQVVLGKPFVEISNMTYDLSLEVVKFTDGTNKIAYKIPHKIERYNSLSDLEKEYTKSVYLRNEEDKRRGVEYVMSKILEFYKECLELGPEYLTGLEDEGGRVTPTLRRLLEDIYMTWAHLEKKFQELLTEPGDDRSFLATPSDHTRDGVRKLMTTSERNRLKRNLRRFDEATALEDLRRRLGLFPIYTDSFLGF